MQPKKKILLFIVEGITDEESLSLILSRLIQDKNVRFFITDGDITTNKLTNEDEPIKAVWKKVKDFLDRNKFKKEDLEKIVHIVDTDGCFVPENAVVQSSENITAYTLENIYAKNEFEIKKRNVKKSKILKNLIDKKVIAKVNYSVYYFSRNLEHVLHNIEEDISDDEKMQYAESFQDRFAQKPEKFIDFISNKDFAVSGNYKDTWNFIFQDVNSLNRFCNFHIFFGITL